MTRRAERARTRKARTRIAPAERAPANGSRTWDIRATGLFLLVLGLIPVANLVTTGGGLAWWSLAVRGWLTWGTPIVIVALIAGFLAPAQIEATVAAFLRLLNRPPAAVFVAVVSVIATGMSLYWGWVMFRLEPVVGDEFAQRFHALILQQGHLSARVALPREFFSTAELLDIHGSWMSQFPVGGPAFLAVGLLIGAPWVINPLLTAVSVAALYYFVRFVRDEESARTTALLACACPFIVYMGGSQMNHVPTLALAWCAFALLAKQPGSDNARAHMLRAAVIGLCLGIAATIRPFDAFLCALLLGVFQLLTERRRQGFWRDASIECVAALIPVIILLIVNHATLGAPLPFAYDVLNGPEHRPGFHLTPLGFEHTPRRGLYMASAYLLKLNLALFGWPLPAILLIALSLLCMRDVTRWDRLLAAMMVAFVLGYSAYWSESYFLGPRFLFILAPALVFYTARFPNALRSRLRMPRLRAAVLLVIPLSIAFAWLVPITTRTPFGVHNLARAYTLRSAASAVDDEVHRQYLSNAVVFVVDTWRERLTARLRAAGARPLSAEHMLTIYDGCTVQRALDAAERAGATGPQVLEAVTNIAEQDIRSAPVPPAATTMRIALIPGRAVDPSCIAELNRQPVIPVSLAEMLPFSTLDSRGALSGPVIYARDLGSSNAALRPTLGNRRWFLAAVTNEGDHFKVTLQPYR